MKPTIRIHFCLLAALVLAGALPRPARAEGASADEEALINRGLELREKKEDEAALRAFQQAEALSHSGRALAQVALAEQALGRWADAESHLGEALHHTREAWVARNQGLLRQALADIQTHLGSLELLGGAAGAEVLVNGAPAGTLPLGAIRVPAGSVALEVRAPGHLPMLRTIIVPAGGLAREPVVLVPVPVETAGAPPPVHVDTPPPVTLTSPGASGSSATSGWSGRKTLGVSLVAAGAASLAVGVVFHLTRNGRASDFNSQGCIDDNGQISGPAAGNCQSRYDGVQHAQDFAIAGYAGAVLLGGAGAYLWLTDRGAGGDQVSALGCGPGGGLGFACAGRF